MDLNHHGEIESFTPRYLLDTESHYSRLKLPIPAPKYAVPIRQGIFTAISAWSSFQDAVQIKLSGQLVLLEYFENNKAAVGRHITVFKEIFFIM